MATIAAASIARASGACGSSGSTDGVQVLQASETSTTCDDGDVLTRPDADTLELEGRWTVLLGVDGGGDMDLFVSGEGGGGELVLVREGAVLDRRVVEEIDQLAQWGISLDEPKAHVFIEPGTGGVMRTFCSVEVPST